MSNIPGFIPAKTYLQRQERLSFAGIELPWDDIQIKGVFRKHTHEYRHMPRGSNEKHGRRFYDFMFQIPLDEFMDANLISANIKGFPGLFNTRLPQIRSMYENGWTDKLVVPSWGSMQAFMTEFEQKLTPHLQSGKRMTLTFVEDNDVAENYSGVALKDNVVTLNNSFKQFQTIATNTGVPLDLFQTISNIVSAINAVTNQVQFAEQFVVAKATELVSECQQLNQDLQFFKDPLNGALLEQFKEVWFSAQQIANPITATSATPNSSTFNANNTVNPFLVANGIQSNFSFLPTYTTKVLMTIQQLSVAIYGVTDRALDILSLNYFDDVFNIPPGTLVKYILP